MLRIDIVKIINFDIISKYSKGTKVYKGSVKLVAMAIEYKVIVD